MAPTTLNLLQRYQIHHTIVLGYNSSIELHVQILICFVDSLHMHLLKMDVDIALRINKSDIA